MKRKLLLFISIFICLVFSFNNSLASDASVEKINSITERDAAKIAFSDYVKVNGQIMIPELGLRVNNVSEESGCYVVVLAVYEKLTNKVVNECATYTINVRNGKIVSVKKSEVQLSENSVNNLVLEIKSGNYSNADFVIAKISENSKDAEAYKALMQKVKQAAMADVMANGTDLLAISKYFDNRLF